MATATAIVAATETIISLIDVAFKIAEIYKIPAEQVASRFQARLAEFKSLDPASDIKDV